MNFVNRQMKGEQWNIHEQTFFLVICVVVMFWRNGTLLLDVGPCAPRVLSAAVLGVEPSDGALMYPCAAHGVRASPQRKKSAMQQMVNMQRSESVSALDILLFGTLLTAFKIHATICFG